MSPLPLRFDAASLDSSRAAALEGRDAWAASSPAVASEVAALLARVRAEGDGALREFARRFDGTALDALEVPRESWKAALEALVRRAC